jgi:hypothetical protein
MAAVRFVWLSEAERSVYFRSRDYFERGRVVAICLAALRAFFESFILLWIRIHQKPRVSYATLFGAGTLRSPQKGTQFDKLSSCMMGANLSQATQRTECKIQP